MTWYRVTLLVGLGALPFACTLPLKGQNEVGLPTNVCAVEGEIGETCGPEGECLRTLCRPVQAPEFPIVFLISRAQISGSSILQPIPIFSIPTLEELRLLAQQDRDLVRSLPAAASLELSLLGPDPKKSTAATSARGCFFNDQAPNRTLPFHVTFRPSRTLSGLPLAIFGGNAVDPNKISPPLNLKASFLLPAALYDLYLVPTVEDSCPIPPILRTDVSLSEQFNVLTVELPSTSRIMGKVKTDSILDLSAWSAEIFEARTGLRVSTKASLLPEGPGSWRVGTLVKGEVAPLEFYRPSGPAGQPTGTLFFTLTPPTGLLAPRLAWELSALDLFGQGEIELDLSSFSLDTVSVEIRTELATERQGQPSWVWLQSDPSPGALFHMPKGAIASFSRGPLATKASGKLSFQIPPGRYEVSAVASSILPLDRVRQSFDFLPSDPDSSAQLAGYSLSLSPPPSLEVPILSALDGTTFVGVPFALSTVASPILPNTMFYQEIPSPRGDSGLTDLNGWLRASADSGFYDLTIRIPPSSGFPWLIKSNLEFPSVDPGALRVSLPIEVRGRLLDPALSDPERRPLVGAWLRAYAQVGDHYVFLAQTPLEPNGSYRLLLPSRF